MSGKKKFKKYGDAPHHVFLLHGGPGAIGDMAPVALELSSLYGVVEIYNKGLSIEKQLQEIFEAIVQNKLANITLLGHSWGAWLALLFAAKYLDKCEKVVIVSCPPFKNEHACDIMDTRINRMEDHERMEMYRIMQEISSNNGMVSKNIMERLGNLYISVDSYELIQENDSPQLHFDYQVYNKVWHEADSLRYNGDLIRKISGVKCPVIAIHADYDPHPVSSVEEILKEIISDFRLFKLEKCGHYPWKEKHAREPFFNLLKEIL